MVVRVLGWVVALSFVISYLAVAPGGAEAAAVVVTMTASDGYLIANRDARRVEVQVPGQPRLTFENAAITITRSRVSITARTPERTLVAWGNRVTENGGIGLLRRTGNPRKPEKYGIWPRQISVDGDGAPQATIVRR
jgi:hypothetical protein